MVIRCIAQGLIPTTVNRESGSGGPSFSVGAAADSYYEYLLKLWLLGGQKVSKSSIQHPSRLWHPTWSLSSGVHMGLAGSHTVLQATAGASGCTGVVELRLIPCRQRKSRQTRTV